LCSYKLVKKVNSFGLKLQRQNEFTSKFGLRVICKNLIILQFALGVAAEILFLACCRKKIAAKDPTAF